MVNIHCSLNELYETRCIDSRGTMPCAFEASLVKHPDRALVVAGRPREHLCRDLLERGDHAQNGWS